jgi:hypothetical protein
MQLTELADRLEACADKLPTFSPRADRLNALADAARDLDRLRNYRDFMRDNIFGLPMGDVERDADNLRYEVRQSLNIASDLRSWSYRELV